MNASKCYWGSGDWDPNENETWEYEENIANTIALDVWIKSKQQHEERGKKILSTTRLPLNAVVSSHI